MGYSFTHRLSRRRERGLSLIEVLVSILILSFGVMGAIAMQLHAIRALQQSTYYSTAMELVSDIAERMRTHVGHTLTPIDIAFDREHVPVFNDCVTSMCLIDSKSEHDISQWLNEVNARLPNARAVICRDSSSLLTWDCNHDARASVVVKLGWSDPSETKFSLPRLAISIAPFY